MKKYARLKETKNIMPGDAVNYHYIAKELDSALNGGRIDKITMPEKDTVILNIRREHKNYSLIISANPSQARCHLTALKFEGAAIPPSFLSHLRKHIGGGHIDKVESVFCERILKFYITAKNEFLLDEKKILVAEIMGKHSNIILLDDGGKISNSIKHFVSPEEGKRCIFPALMYSPPAAQSKADLSSVSALKSVLGAFEGGNLSTYIQRNVSGLAKQTINEVVFRVFQNKIPTHFSDENLSDLANEFVKLYDEKNYCPSLILSDNRPLDYCFYCPKESDVNYKVAPSLNAAMDEFFSAAGALDKTKKFKEKLIAVVKNAIAKSEKRIAVLAENIDAASDYEYDKKCGELITSNMYKLSRGADFVMLNDYTTEDYREIKIALDPLLSPQQNAQSYYKKYNKKKKTLISANGQIEKINEEIEYLKTVLSSLEICDKKEELTDIENELSSASVIKSRKFIKAVSLKQQARNKAKQQVSSAPMTLEFNGYKIFVGKNNLQNDALTKKSAASDVWLHVKDIHGSHVVIENKSKDMPPDDVIVYAAAVAAFYSKAKNQDKAAVDYTFIKNVFKQSGAKPGAVVFKNQHTVFVTPINPEQ